MSLNEPNGGASGTATAEQGLSAVVSRTRVADVIGDRNELYCLGPGETIEQAAQKLLEWRVRTLAPDAPLPDDFLIDRHFTRKHGPTAYYGQK